jgi:hypothetical protein
VIAIVVYPGLMVYTALESENPKNKMNGRDHEQARKKINRSA